MNAPTPATNATRDLPTAFINESSGDEFCYSSTNVFYFQVVDSKSPYVVNSTLNGVLAIFAIVANVVVFNAIRRTTSIRQPSKLLLLSLVLTDLGVGLAAQPQFAIYLVAKLRGDLSVSCFTFQSYTFMGAVLTFVSLLTMTAISVDRYFAFFSRLRYREIVTSRKVAVILVFVWESSVLFATAMFFSEGLFNFTAITGIISCNALISLVYIKIYRGLRQKNGRRSGNQEQNTASPDTRPTLNVARYRRTLSSMIWICGFGVLCYTPLLFMRILLVFYPSDIVYCVFEFSVTMMFLNSCLNPFVYFFQVAEIRVKVVQDLRKLCWCKFCGDTSVIEH